MPPDFMANMDGREETELITELIVTFRVETANHLHRLRLAFANSDRQTVRATAHCIKGGARQMGARALASLCHEIELRAEVEPVERIAVLASRLDPAFANACEAMTKYAQRFARN